MIWSTVLHVAPLWLILSVASAQISNDQKNTILELHNKYRSLVNPSAENMKRMLWDDTLSQVAGRYAAECRWDHNPHIYGILGENLFMALGPLFVSQPLDLWYNEFKNYNFITDRCTEGQQCGHYTQMVWANTNFVGCASHFCSNVSNFNAQNATILVCNYYPAGNIMGVPPYKDGLPCISCPSGTIGCKDKYCDQGTFMSVASTVPNINDLIASGNMENTASNLNSGSSARSAALLLLAALMTFYVWMT